jgi:hypothetical protein
MNISKPNDPLGSLIWDGGFETDVIDGGLSWRVQRLPGSMVQYDQVTKHSGGRALRVGFDREHNLDFQGICHLVVVNPETSYEFSAWLRTDAVTTDRGLFLRLNTPKNPELVVGTPEFTGTHPWTQLNLKWKAGTDVYLLQVCLARMPSSREFANKTAGLVWLDDVSLLPVAPPLVNILRCFFDGVDIPRNSR